MHFSHTANHNIILIKLLKKYISYNTQFSHNELLQKFMCLYICKMYK